MLTDQDIQKLVAVFATKQDVNDLKEDVSALRETTQGLVTAIDKLAKVIDDLRHEYVSVTSQLDRHERWIKEIAKKAGMALEA